MRYRCFECGVYLPSYHPQARIVEVRPNADHHNFMLMPEHFCQDCYLKLLLETELLKNALKDYANYIGSEKIPLIFRIRTL